jgi:hypothetical protein
VSVDEVQLSVDGVGDVSLERSGRLALGLALSHFPLELDPSLGVGLTGLADGHHMDGVAELTVATATLAMDRAPSG